jgi:ankyrin repeat protein
VVEFLLDRGADPNLKSAKWGTALDAAIKNNRPECVTVLLEFIPGAEDGEDSQDGD